MAKTMYQATGRRKILTSARKISLRTKSEDLSSSQVHSEALMLSLPLTAAVSQARQEHSDTESQEHFAKSMKRLTDLHSRQLVS